VKRGADPASRPTALITGASSGIGLELSRLFAADGHRLVLVARDRGRLESLAGELRSRFGVESLILPRDLADPGAPASIFEELARAGVTVEVLVNNAGCGLLGRFWEGDPARELAMIQVNVAALTHLTRLALPSMVARREGKVLNVASTAAFQPGPLMAVYYATKAYVLSFSEALSKELSGRGVTVTALCPGPTETGFQKAAGMERSRLFRRGLVMDAAAVARAGYRGLLRGKRVVVPGFKNRCMAQAASWAPRPLVLWVSKRLQESRSR
jgi:short-subunit dehydrogenase